jgi:hypothetical protein
MKAATRSCGLPGIQERSVFHHFHSDYRIFTKMSLTLIFECFRTVGAES